MKVHGSNLKHALEIAIVTQKEYEERLNYKYDSAFLAGLRKVYEALKNEEQLEILY